MAAMVGIGISAAYGISTTSTSTSTTECTIPAMGVRPPFLMLVAVLAMAPVAGIPPNNAEPILPIPCATSSILDLCFDPIILSATTQDNKDSIAASTAMVKPSEISPATTEKLILGICKAGRLLLIV